MHPRRTNWTLTKAASIPARRQKAQGILDLIFDAAPHLEHFFQFVELSTKAAFAKAAFDTLKFKEVTVFKGQPPCMQGREIRAPVPVPLVNRAGTNGAKFAVFRRFSLIFVDFRFSWEIQHFGSADFRRKPQENADFSQKTADFRRNRFVPFSLSLLIPP